MLHTLFNLTRPLFVIDTETTGVDVKTDRIVELGFQQWMPNTITCNCEFASSGAHGIGCPNPSGRAAGMLKEWRTLIDPLVPIPEGAIAVHGITNEKIEACQRCGGELSLCCDNPKIAPTFKQLGPSLLRGFKDCDYAGKNVRFDLRILAAEFQRNGFAWSYVGARIIDAERLEQLAVPRSLSHLHEKYTGRPHDGAHGALSDVRASTTVIVKQLETYPQLSRDLDALHELQWPGWLTADGSFRLVNGTPTCMFGKHVGKPLKAIPNDYLDFILGNNFPEDVKQLARDAKMGKYPEVTTNQAQAADRHIV